LGRAFGKGGFVMGKNLGEICVAIKDEMFSKSIRESTPDWWGENFRVTHVLNGAELRITIEGIIRGNNHNVKLLIVEDNDSYEKNNIIREYAERLRGVTQVIWYHTKDKAAESFALSHGFVYVEKPKDGLLYEKIREALTLNTNPDSV
jgi:hypothetical protein